MKVVPKYLFRYFEKAGVKRKYPANSIIYMQGDTAPSIYLICKGRVRMFYTADSGKEITIQIIGEGQLIGESAFFSHASRDTSILAVNEVEVIVCSIDRIFPYMQQNPEINELIIQLLMENYSALCGQLKRLTIYDSTQRVASYLLDQTKCDCAELGIIDNTLPYTHEELAVCLNLNRVTVTKILNRFAKQGWVRLKQKKIQILARGALKKILDENRKTASSKYTYN